MLALAAGAFSSFGLCLRNRALASHAACRTPLRIVHVPSCTIPDDLNDAAQSHFWQHPRHRPVGGDIRRNHIRQGQNAAHRLLWHSCRNPAQGTARCLASSQHLRFAASLHQHQTSRVLSLIPIPRTEELQAASAPCALQCGLSAHGRHEAS